MYASSHKHREKGHEHIYSATFIIDDPIFEYPAGFLQFLQRMCYRKSNSKRYKVSITFRIDKLIHIFERSVTSKMLKDLLPSSLYRICSYYLQPSQQETCFRAVYVLKNLLTVSSCWKNSELYFCFYFCIRIAERAFNSSELSSTSLRQPPGGSIIPLETQKPKSVHFLLRYIRALDCSGTL